jgi:hypothetical protein
MDMEILLESLTEWMETETTDETDDENTVNETDDDTTANDTPDDQGGSLPENTGITASTFANQRRPLFGKNENDSEISLSDEYNVIFCVDTRDNDKLGEFESYIDMTIKKITRSDRPKANFFWCNNLEGTDNFNGSNLYAKRLETDGIESVAGTFPRYTDEDKADQNHDITYAVNVALENCNYDSNYKTYVFVLYNPTLALSEKVPADKLSINTAAEKISFSIIAPINSYKDDAYAYNLATATQGTIINTNNADVPKPEYVARLVLNYLRAEALEKEPIKIISSVGLTVLSSPFDSDYIKLLHDSKYNYSDTDSDGLLDREEIYLKSDLIDFDNDSVLLPSIQQCIDYVEIGGLRYVRDGLTRYLNSIDKDGERENSINHILSSVRILPLLSDPTMPDSDGDYMLDCYDNNLDKTKYDTIVDENPLYAFSNTDDLYGYNNANIFIQKTKIPHDRFYDFKKLTIDVEIFYSANIEPENGNKSGYNKAAVGNYRFSYEVQEYMYSVCETIINKYKQSGNLKQETIEFLEKYLTPELLMAIGTTESGWANDISNKIGMTPSGSAAIPNCIGGSGASSTASDYFDIRSGVAGAAVIIAHNIREQIEGGWSNVYNNQRDNQGELVDSQVLYNALVVYGKRTKSGYLAEETAMSSAYKFYSF